MWLNMNNVLLVSQFICCLLFGSILLGQAKVLRHTFIVKEAPYTRLCSTKNILTVNGSFPGPILYAHRGDTLIVDVINKGNENITLHWHGSKQPRSPWWDGPAYITQCPIQPGSRFWHKILLSTEEGTLWWHAHSRWARATVHGAFVVYPTKGTDYPFPKPHVEVPIILGEWWKSSVPQVLKQMLVSGGDPKFSDAHLINGQPGDLYNCSKKDTYRLRVESGKTYMLRMVNAVMNTVVLFAVANHQLTVVGTDGSYVKPFNSDYVAISPGQTLDLLLQADQTPNHYYMAAKALNTAAPVGYDNTTTTAIVEYSGDYPRPRNPMFPVLPRHDDVFAPFNFTNKLRSLRDKKHRVNVPLHVTTNLFFAISINNRPCDRKHGRKCAGPNGMMFAGSVNNNSFVLPRVDLLSAYHRHISGVYTEEFPRVPPMVFDFTGTNLSATLLVPERNKTAKVVVLEYGSTVEIVLQGTNVVVGIEHPMHLHGHNFYVVGSGFGNFDRDKDPKKYNLVDPPLMNTIVVPKNGWTAIRFKANNPGVWFMHCHLERHTTWGMEMTFIVKDGKRSNQKMVPPPSDMPKC